MNCRLHRIIDDALVDGDDFYLNRRNNRLNKLDYVLVNKYEIDMLLAESVKWEAEEDDA